MSLDRSSRPEIFLRKGVLKICSRFTGEYPCRSVISIKLQSMGVRHGCSTLNSLLLFFRTPFPKSISGQLLLTRKTTLLQYTLLTLFLRNGWGAKLPYPTTFLNIFLKNESSITFGSLSFKESDFIHDRHT